MTNFSKFCALSMHINHEMQSLKWRIGSKIRLKWNVPWFSVFVDQTNLKIIWKFSLNQYRCHKTPIDVENCVKSALNSNHRKQNFTVITNWGVGDYQLRSALATKQIWVVVITIWGTLDSLPQSAKGWKCIVVNQECPSLNRRSLERTHEVHLNGAYWFYFEHLKILMVQLGPIRLEFCSSN